MLLHLNRPQSVKHKHNFNIHWEAKKKIVTRFIGIFALLQHSGTSTVSPRYACIANHNHMMRATVKCILTSEMLKCEKKKCILEWM